MRLTNATEQAISIMAIIAMQDPSTMVTSDIIYNKLSVSQSYIKKLLRKLVVSNLIESISGSNGGFRLKKDISNISLLEIVEAIEGPIVTFSDKGVITRAFSDFDKKAVCGHNVVLNYFKDADNEWKNYLKLVSIEDILKKIFQTDIPFVDWNKI